MTKFSLSSHRKGLRLFLSVSLSLALLGLTLNVFCTLLLNRQLKKLQELVGKCPGYHFEFKSAAFNVLSGFSVKKLAFGKGTEVYFTARRIDAGLDIFSLFQARRALIKNIRIHQPQVYLNRVSDAVSVWSGVLSHLDKRVGFFETVNFQGTQARFDDSVLLDLKGYLSVIKGNLLISRGTLLFKKIQVPAFPDIDLLRGSNFYKPFDYVFEAEGQDGDFVISRFELSNPILKFTGSGRIRDVAEAPEADLDIRFLNVILDAFPALNHEHMQARGVVDSVLKVTGPLSDLKVLLNVKITNAQFTFFDSVFLTKVNGSCVISQDHMIGQGFSLDVNNFPLSADITFYSRDYPHVLLELSSRTKAPEPPTFVLTLSADWIEDELVGDLKTHVRYATKDTINAMDFRLQGFHLGYEDDLFINARELEAGLSIEPDPRAAFEKFQRSLSLQHFFCVVRRQESGFALDHLKSTCYGGTLEGEVNFTPAGEQLFVNGEGHLRDVALEEFFKEPKEGEYVLWGELDGDLKFDNQIADMFKGQLFIKDGLIEHNPLLNAVADFLGVPSLKKVAFKDLSCFFTGGRGEYVSQVKLQSPLVNGSLDGKISSYDKMDGYLTVNLATELLNESKQFKKILTYIRHDQPSVTFPFKISSYIRSPRVLWLKNEFKEKLQNLLPERNKRVLQRQVNQMVERIEGE